MKKVGLLSLLMLIFSLSAMAQSERDKTEKPVNYFTLPFETQLKVTGSLNDEIPYWIGFDKKSYYNENDLQNVLQQAAKHIAGLKDSLQNPYTQKKLRIVLFPDGKTATFNLKEKDNGKEFTFYNGEYQPLKTSYDTLEIVQRKTKLRADDDERYVLYVFSLKDINDLEDALHKIQFQQAETTLAKNIKRASGFLNNFHTDIGFGAMVNTAIPIGIHTHVGYYYAFGKSEVGKNIVGLFASATMGMAKDTLMGLGSYGVEFGSAKIVNGRMLQRASFITGLQYRTKQSKQDGKPVFFLGFNLPVGNNFSATFIMASDFKKDYTNPNRKTNFGVGFIYNL